MKAPKADQAEIRRLHFEEPSGSTSQPWKNPPTRISVPTAMPSQPPRQSRQNAGASNPFSRDRLGNNLKKGNDPKKGIKKPDVSGGGKKPRLENDRDVHSQMGLQRAKNGSGNLNRRTTEIPSSPVPPSSSPDELDCIESTRDGPSTSAFRRQRRADGDHQGSDDDYEDIEQYSDEKSSKAHRPSGSRPRQRGAKINPIIYESVEPTQRETTAQNEVINIDDEDEPDLASSTLPRRFDTNRHNTAASSSKRLSTSRENVPAGIVKQHTLTYEENDRRSSFSEMSLHQEGRSTKPLSGGAASSSSRGPPRNPSADTKPTQPFQLLDLEKISTKKSQMKGKPGPKKQSPLTTLALTPSTTTKTRKAVAKAPRNNKFVVAVDEWCCLPAQKSDSMEAPRGKRRRHSTLLYNSAAKTILVTAKGSTEEEPDPHPLMLNLQSRVPQRIQITGDTGPSNAYLIIAMQVVAPDEDYAFLFDKEQTAYFEALRTQLKSQFQVDEVGKVASGAIWENHKEGSDLIAKKRKREEEETEDFYHTSSHELLYPTEHEDGKEDFEISSDPQRRTSARIAHAQATKNLPALDPEELILVYPPAAVGALNITNGDLKRLNHGEFLNDTLIEFGLKYWLKNLEDTDPELANEIHIFSSFFYKKLNVKNHDEGFQSVRRWTSKMDIFSKKFVIIPINENLHWYLAIIYLPEHTLLPPQPHSPTKAPLTRQRGRISTSGIDDSGVSFTGALPAMPSEETSASVAEPSVSATPEAEQQDDMEMDEVMQALETSSIQDGSTNVNQAPDEDVDMEISSPEPPPPPRVTDVDAPDSLFDEDHSTVASDRCTPGKSEDGGHISIDDSQEIAETPANGMTGASAPTFYATAPTNTYTRRSGRKRHSEPGYLGSVAIEREESVEIEDGPAPPLADSKHTWIFTLDSMGGTHKQAGNVLRDYLLNEAKDKKGNQNPNLPQPKKLPVPQQPNYCDCGLYLLHFAKMFVTQPEKYLQMGTMKKVPPGQLDKEWDKPAVGVFRDRLSDLIKGLSKEWKETKKRKDAEQAAAPEGVNEADESSDDDICLVEPPVAAEEDQEARAPKRPPAKPRQGRTGKAKPAAPDSATETSAGPFKPPSSAVSSEKPSREASEPPSASVTSESAIEISDEPDASGRPKERVSRLRDGKC